MKDFSKKHPVLLVIIQFVVTLLLAGIVAGVLNGAGFNNEVSGSIARILVGIVLLGVSYKCFRFGSFFRGMIVMLPALLLAIYKIPYHFVNGGGAVNAVTIPIVLIGLAPAIYEEVLFRGILIYNLKKKYDSPMTIVLISAIVFSLVHLTNIMGMDLISLGLQLVMALVVGIVLGAIYLNTGDLVSVIFVHFMIDVLSGIFPGGMMTPYYFIVILVVIWIIEIIYGFILVRKVVNKRV